MSLTDFLRQRRSIRKYTPKNVPTELIKELLETASYAPSAHNAQPWHFIVLTETERKNCLVEAMGQVWLAELEKEHIPKNIRWATVERSIERFTSAPVLILACLTMDGMDVYHDAERQRAERDLAVQSLAAAIQTMLLAAHTKGLGACWHCAPVFCKTAVRQAVGIPENVEPQALITLGYPDEAPRTPLRRPVKVFVHEEKWGNPL